MLTAIGPPVGTGAADAAAGARRIAIASEDNSEQARTAMRKEPSDILYPGTLTSRQKRYAAEPAPDMANLPLIDEGTGNGGHVLCVIPGRASWREPGIQRRSAMLDSGFALRAPRNDRAYCRKG